MTTNNLARPIAVDVLLRQAHLELRAVDKAVSTQRHLVRRLRNEGSLAAATAQEALLLEEVEMQKELHEIFEAMLALRHAAQEAWGAS